MRGSRSEKKIQQRTTTNSQTKKQLNYTAKMEFDKFSLENFTRRHLTVFRSLFSGLAILAFYV